MGILFSDQLYADYHHRLTHGSAGGIFVFLAVSLLARNAKVGGLALVAYHLHLLCDLVGSGPGWPLWYFYPLNLTEWMLSWQWDPASWQNSVIGMFITLLCLAAAVRWRRTPVELFSEKADEKVVETLRKRFLRAE